MNTTPTTQRAKILEGVRAMIETDFAAGKTFRKVERKAWVPGEAMRPSVVINDDGASKSSDKNQDETTKVILLKFQVIINLAADFASSQQAQDWTDIVELLRLAIQNFNPKCGVKRVDVLDDTPVKAEFGGVSEHIWVIECESEYFVEVQAFA